MSDDLDPSKTVQCRAQVTQSGFALIIVIWGLGIIGLFAIVYIAGAKSRFNVAINHDSSLRAESAADGALNLMADRLQTAKAASAVEVPDGGAPRLCRLFDGVAVAVSVEDEAGKIDLNGANPSLLTRAFTSLGVSGADQLATSIVEFRTVRVGRSDGLDQRYAAAGLPAGPKRNLFETVFELDQVIGMNPNLMGRLLPFVTVSSQRSGIDPQLAPSALLAALAGASPETVQQLVDNPAASADMALRRPDALPLAFTQLGSSGVFLLTAEAILHDGTIAVRQALLDIRAAAAGRMTFKEMRRPPSRFATLLQQARSKDHRFASMQAC